MFAKDRSGPRQLNRSSHAVEERHPDFLLQLFDLRGQGRLRHRKSLRRLGKMQGVGDREKIAVVLETGSQKVLRLPLGASASGWSVAQVAPRSVTLTRGPQSVTLELPKPALR